MTCDSTTLSLGAYLLGALDDADRSAVEAHLGDCEHCRAELADLAALPSLMELLTLEDFAIEPPDHVPDDLFDRVAARAREQDDELDRRRSSRHRYRRLTAVAAAVVVIAGGTVGAVAIASHHGGSSSGVVAGPQIVFAHSGRISMRVALAAQTTGTSLQVKVAGLPDDEHCQLVAIARDGSREVVGQWSATYAGAAQVTGSTTIARKNLWKLVLLGTHGQHLVTASV